MRADLINTILEAKTPMSGRAFIRTPALVALLVFAFAAPAAAQTSPTTDAYGGTQSEVLGNFQGGGQDDVVLSAGVEVAEDLALRSAVGVRRRVRDRLGERG